MNFELRTPRLPKYQYGGQANSLTSPKPCPPQGFCRRGFVQAGELKTIFLQRHSLDDVLSQLALMDSIPRRPLFWGDGVGGIASYVAGWMAGKGIDVILLDGANRFDPYMVSSFARKAWIPPEKLLKKIRIARAFTCYQMATLMGEKLPELIEHERDGLPDLFPSPFDACLREAASAKAGRRVRGDQKDLDPLHRRPWVIVLGPITTFFDEDVPEREVRPLFERSLKRVEEMTMEGIPFFFFQPSTSAFPPAFRQAGTQRGVRSFMDSKRGYLMRRLFQFSNRVWRISLEDEGPKLILEKGLTEKSLLLSKEKVSVSIPLSPPGERARVRGEVDEIPS